MTALFDILTWTEPVERDTNELYPSYEQKKYFKNSGRIKSLLTFCLGIDNSFP